jgi:hypothetical protein
MPARGASVENWKRGGCFLGGEADDLARAWGFGRELELRRNFMRV